MDNDAARAPITVTLLLPSTVFWF